MKDIVVNVKNLKKYFKIRSDFLSSKHEKIHAVDNVSFNIKQGEIFGLIGESGSGKTTLGKCILRLIEPNSGKIFLWDKNILDLKGKNLITLRRKAQMIFQEHYSSLNPSMNIYDAISEPIKAIKTKSKGHMKSKVKDLLNNVGLSPADMYKFPHQFSGGQRQRICIARALSVNPAFIIADEPVAALDASIKVEILNLMKDLQRDLKLTYLYISHDLSMIKYMCDRIGVMYVGKIIEISDTRELFKNPKHPYLEGLISAIPIPNPTIRRKKSILKDEIPSLINPPSGCRFHPRCPYQITECKINEPELIEIDKGHLVACHKAA